MVRKTPVIIDTDPGVDDTLAILLALASPEIEILAILVTFGNTDVDACYLNVFRIYRAIERHLAVHPEDVPRFPNFNPETRPILVKGSARPLAGDIHGAQYFHGRDGLGGLSERHPDYDAGCDLHSESERYFRESTASAAEVTVGLLRDRPERSVIYVALGPMTTLREACRYDGSTIRDRIGSVVCMGGALDVPGNTSAVAEFNWFADPWAVKDLLMKPDEGIPLDRLLLLPLDITTPHELPFAVYQKYIDKAFKSTASPSKPGGKPPIQHFTSSFFERTREVMLSFGKDAMELHDPVAMWCVIANPLIGECHDGLDVSQRLGPEWRARRRVFDIERTGELTRGMVVVDRRMDEGAYELGANRSYAQTELGEAAPAAPAPVEVETAAAAELLANDSVREQPHGTDVGSDAGPNTESSKGILCVDRTPGPAALLALMLERVWGFKE